MEKPGFYGLRGHCQRMVLFREIPEELISSLPSLLTKHRDLLEKPSNSPVPSQRSLSFPSQKRGRTSLVWVQGSVSGFCVEHRMNKWSVPCACRTNARTSSYRVSKAVGFASMGTCSSLFGSCEHLQVCCVGHSAMSVRGPAGAW